MNRRPFWQQCLLYLWVSPITLICLPIAWWAKATGGGYAMHGTVLEVWGGKVGQQLERGIPLLGAVNAVTLGHLVAGVTLDHLDASRVHERTHVEQFERWGFFFPLVYLLRGLYAHWCGGHFYWDNPYEIEARQRAAQSRQHSLINQRE